MPKDIRSLGELELEVMKTVWGRSEVAVADVVEALRPRKLHYNTVMTVMNRLARKGFLRRQARGRAYAYQASVSREEVSRAYLGQVTRHFFGGSVSRTVAALLGSERPSAKGSVRLRELLGRIDVKPT